MATNGARGSSWGAYRLGRLQRGVRHAGGDYRAAAGRPGVDAALEPSGALAHELDEPALLDAGHGVRHEALGVRRRLNGDDELQADGLELLVGVVHLHHADDGLRVDTRVGLHQALDVLDLIGLERLLDLASEHPLDALDLPGRGDDLMRGGRMSVAGLACGGLGAPGDTGLHVALEELLELLRRGLATIVVALGVAHVDPFQGFVLR